MLSGILPTRLMNRKLDTSSQNTRRMVLGDSQTVAMLWATEKYPELGEMFKVAFTGAGRSAAQIFETKKREFSSETISDRYQKAELRAKRFDILFCSLGGGEHPKLWSYNGTTETFGAEQDPLIPSEVRQYFVERAEQKFVWLNILRAKRDFKNVYFLSAPPPPKSNQFCVDLRVEKLATGGRTIEPRPDLFTPPETRLRTWEIMEQVNRDFCSDLSIPYIHPPEAAVEDDGFLKEAYWRDSFHGNVEYGRLCLEQLAKIEMKH